MNEVEATERVLIYGSRTWTDEAAIDAFVAMLPTGTVVIHGAQKSWNPKTRTWFGADYFADKAAKRYGLDIDPYPADWNGLGRAAGPMRNQQMVDHGKPTRARGYRMSGKSNGTDDMTRRLAKAGIPHEIVTTPPRTDAAAADACTHAVIGLHGLCTNCGEYVPEESRL